MYHLKSIVLATALVAVAACSDTIDELAVTPVANSPIQLSGSIVQQNVTRANEQGFVTGDRMGVYIVDYEASQGGEMEPGDMAASGIRAQNVLYTFNGDTYTWTAPTTIYWRDKETPVDIYAYYPSANYIGTPSAYNFEVQADQSIEARNGDLCTYEQSDLLWGKQTKVSPTSEVVTVKLSHRLAGVRVLIKKGEGITDAEWAKLDRIVTIDNTVRQATVDLSTGMASPTPSHGGELIRMASNLSEASGESGDGGQVSPPSGESEGVYRAIVIPQTVAAGKTLVSITIDGVSYSHTLTQPMQYQGGKLHNFTITVNKSEQTGDYSIALSDDGITPWVNDEQSHQFSSMQYVVVNCPEIGKLKESITAAGFDYKTIQNLRVTGELASEDLQLINNEMPELHHLNLYNVQVRHIRYYDGWWDYGNHEHDLFMDDYLGDIDRNQSIRSMVLPKKLKRISGFTHMGLMYSTVELPEGLTRIDDGAFAYNENNGMELILPSTLDSIGSSSLQYCNWNCELKLSDNISYIAGCWATAAGAPHFHGVFHVPQKLKDIPEGCFIFGSNGSFTGQIEIPQGITSIGRRAFNVSLKNRLDMTLPSGLKSIGNAAFIGQRFNSLHLNDDLEVIESSAFEGCSMPFQLILPNSLSQVGFAAFRGCGIEGELVIPENCLEIAGAAFSGNQLTKITLPSRLEMISGESFRGNHQLTSITIPKYVNYICEWAFSACDGLQTVICLNPEPPILEQRAFEGVYFDKCVLEVPEQSVELYRHADGWKDFQNITAYHELAFNVSEIICLNKGTTRQGILRAEGDWEVSECPDWVTVTPSSGNYKDELTITVGSTTESREGRIVFRLKDKNYTTYTDVRQVYSDDYREDATVTLQEASSEATPIPLFLVGEGYGADDIASGQYLTDMKEQMEHLFSTEPYKSYRQYFTVSTAFACSPQQGLGSLTKFSGNNNRVWEYAQQHGTGINGHTAVLVLCNTPAYGCHTDLWDNGLSFSWLGKNTDIYPYDQRGDVLHHLGGRGFGKLGPEYVNHFTFMKACTCPGCNMTNEYNWARSKGWWQNVSITPKMTELPWYPFIFHEKYAQMVDVYEGALNHARSTYRSENQSVMGAVHVYYYNTISRYEIVHRIMEAAGKSITLEQFIDSDKIELPEN